MQRLLLHFLLSVVLGAMTLPAHAAEPKALATATQMVVVTTGDAVLVMPKSRSQEVRRLVQELGARGREELL